MRRSSLLQMSVMARMGEVVDLLGNAEVMPEEEVVVVESGALHHALDGEDHMIRVATLHGGDGIRERLAGDGGAFLSLFSCTTVSNTHMLAMHAWNQSTERVWIETYVRVDRSCAYKRQCHELTRSQTTEIGLC